MHNETPTFSGFRVVCWLPAAQKPEQLSLHSLLLNSKSLTPVLEHVGNKVMRRSVFFGSLILCLLVLPSYLAAKKFDLDDLRIRAEVQPDGRLRVVEDITYDFDGRFRYAFRTIPLKPGESISEIRVLEDSHSLVASSSGEPGTAPGVAIQQWCRDSMEFPGAE